MISTRLEISELGNGRMDRVEFTGGYFSLINDSIGDADISARSYVLDYLGSVRAVCEGESGKLLESIDYMPSGLVFGRMNHDMPHRRFFCGKEELPLAELKLYDSTARLQDAYIPRFTTMDPLAEKYYHISPYAYCGNNPVMLVDPDGREVITADILARRNIINTLSKAEAKYVRFEDNGRLDVTLLNQYSGSSENFTALHALANSETSYIFAVANQDINGSKFFEKGSNPENPNNFSYGVTNMPGMEHDPSVIVFLKRQK